MILSLFLAAFGSLAPQDSTPPAFSKPSQAWFYANEPMANWESDLKSGKKPKERFAPMGEVRKRSNAQCSLFSVDQFNGEELYWLAKLCQEDFRRGRPAIEKYLSPREQSDQVTGAPRYRAEAHLLLAVFQMMETHDWARVWPTYRTVLQEDPIGSEQEVAMRAAIEDEAEHDESTALKWSEERYDLLSQRTKTPATDASRISPEWTIMAGADLVHRYYLAGKPEEAHRALDSIISLDRDARSKTGSWSADQLYWAQMEMNPAPPIPVVKAFGHSLGSDLIQEGRVEVISFFFLRCAPCISELEHLQDFEKRYAKDKVLVADVTTYKAALQPDAPSAATVETEMQKLRHKHAHHLTMAITPDKALQDYGIHSFPVVAVIDKHGRFRYSGFTITFDEGETIDQLVQKLLLEP